MSLPQSRQSPLAQSDLPQEDDPSRSSNIGRYDSIQGALGGRRVSQPVPLAYLRTNSDSLAPPQPHMPPDSRYAYPPSSSSAQNHQYPYEHQYPPSSSYATSVYSHNSLPRMRTPHSLSEPSRTPVNQPPQGYGLPYLTYPSGSQYAVPSGMPAPPWSTAYSHYPQSPTDASVSPELVRVEPMAQASQQDPGPYRTSDAPASPHVDTSRHVSGSSRDVGPSESKGKQREGLPPIHRTRNSQEPDYHKLFETYRLLLDNANPSPTLASPLHALPSGLPSSDVLSRLYEFALDGVRQFDSSEQGEPPPRSPSPQSRFQQSKDDGKGSSKRQRTDPSSAVDSQKCMGCGATSTPEWRRGPLGPRTLCNACGLVYAKLIKKRGRAEAGRFIEGAASFAATSAAENVPSEFNQDFGGGVTSGSTGVQQPSHLHQDDDDRDGHPQGASSAEGEGSEDDSYEDLPSHPGSRPQQEDRR